MSLQYAPNHRWPKTVSIPHQTHCPFIIEPIFHHFIYSWYFQLIVHISDDKCQLVLHFLYIQTVGWTFNLKHSNFPPNYIIREHCIVMVPYFCMDLQMWKLNFHSRNSEDLDTVNTIHNQYVFFNCVIYPYCIPKWNK